MRASVSLIFLATAMSILVEKIKWEKQLTPLNGLKAVSFLRKKYEELSEEERIGKYPTGILHHDTNKLEYCKAYQQVQEKAQAKKGGAK